MRAARTSVLEFDNLFLQDPPLDVSPAKEIEAPLERRFNPPKFIADFSGKNHSLNIPKRQCIHGSYLRQRNDVMLF